jgi:hypothetical protein
MKNSSFQYQRLELEQNHDIKTVIWRNQVLVLFYLILHNSHNIPNQVVKLSKPVKQLDRLIFPYNGCFRTCCQVVKIFNNCENSIILYIKLVVGIIFIEINILDNLTTSSQPLKSWGFWLVMSSDKF